VARASVAPALVLTATLNPQAVTFRERVGIPTAINNLADTCLSQRPLAGFSYLQDVLKLSFFPWKSAAMREHFLLAIYSYAPAQRARAEAGENARPIQSRT
jgi:hypothetical protein